MAELPPLLRNELVMYLHSDLIKQVPLFHGMHEDAIIMFVLKMHPLHFTRGQHVFRVGVRGRDMFFIRRGEVDVLDENDELLCTLKDGPSLTLLILI